MFNRNSILPACLVAMAMPMAANADDYRAEIDLSFDRALLDGDYLPDPDVWGLGATFYFEPVKTDGVPLAEAAFLNRSSFVGAGVVRSELGDEKLDAFGAGIGYYLPNTIFYGELNFTYLDDFGGDQSRVSGALGVAPIDGLLVTSRFDEDGWDPNVRARYVGKFPNAHFFAATVDVYEEQSGDDIDFALGFDYFFDTTFSAGATLSEYSSQLRAEKFFTPRFSVGAHFDIGDDDLGDGFGARVSWRF
jgi:hypothetical protein